MKAQTKVLGLLDGFLAKSRPVNKPYRAIQKTEEFKTFKNMFREGIKDQGEWVAKSFPKLAENAGIEDNLEPLDSIQISKLRGLIVRDMPELTKYVSEFKTFQLLKDFFEWSAAQQYKRWGYMVKAAVQFELSNAKYIAELQKRAAYLMNQSSLDETTIDQIIDLVSEGRLDGMTNAEVADLLADQFSEISEARADMIARTEAANSIGNANHATAVENGAKTHSWVTAGSNPCEICIANEDDGEIPINQAFSSGDMSEPAHPNDECYTEAGEIDLDSIDIWGGE